MMSKLLKDDHAEVGGLFKELDAALGAGDKEKAFALLDMVWARLAVHIRAEHLCLFPAILHTLAAHPQAQLKAGVTNAQAQALIAHLRDDHNFFMDELASAVKVMRQLLAKPDDKAEADGLLLEVRQKVEAVGSRLDEHNGLEEEQLYRWPADLLTAAEQARLLARVQRELENMPPRFAAE
jgi:hypothetical protein